MSGIVCVILEGSLAFPLSAVDSRYCCSIGSVRARAARENFKDFDVLAPQIPIVFSETYPPTYLPAYRRPQAAEPLAEPTYLPSDACAKLRTPRKNVTQNKKR